MVLMLQILLCLLVGTLSLAPRHQLLQTESHLFTPTQPVHQGTAGGGIGAAFAGFIFGPLLLICAVVCIWFNEKKAAIDSRRLKLAEQICEDVDVNSQVSAMKENGKLVYAKGQTNTNIVIEDPLSGVGGPQLIKINREVEVLEWRKHHQKDRGDYYQLSWVSSNSPNEGHYMNPQSCWFIKNETIYNPQVYLGGYHIGQKTADKCEKAIPFTPTIEHGQRIVYKTGGMRSTQIRNEYIYFSPMNQQSYGNPNGYGSPPNGYGGPNGPNGPNGPYPQNYGGNGYPYQQPIQGFDSQPGTLRVKYTLCPTGEMSLICQARGDTLDEFPIAEYEGTTDQTNNVPNNCCCLISSCYAEMLKPIETVLIVKEKYATKEEIFDEAFSNTKLFAACVRFGCYCLLVASICLFFSPITAIIGYIPLIGGIISGVVGFAIFLAALIICIPLFLIVLSIAWLRFHPKVGIAIILIGGVILTVLLIVSRSKG